MSIKSQRSLYEECSEIVERSYSVRSYSYESESSCEDEDECLSRELLMKLTPAALCKLRRCFKKTRDKKDAVDIDRRVEEVMRIAAAEEGIEFAATPTPTAADPRCLDEAGFIAAIENIFGSHKYSIHASKLFHLLDSFNTGKVRWSQLLARLVAIGAKKTGSRAEKWKCLGEGQVRRLEHCKREPVVKMVYLEREEWCCYAAITRAGRVGVYSGDLELLHHYEVFYHRTGSQRRVRNCWITDAIYLPDVQCLVLSASDRSLTIYDAAILNHTLLYCITGMPNIPTCLAYTPVAGGTSASELCVGTSRGELVRVRFLQPRVALLYAKSHEHANYYFWMELTSPPHTSYILILPALSVHVRSVRRVTYMRSDVTVSAALDATTSVVIKHTPGKIRDYVFKVPRGVSCYHILPNLHLLVTGSPDGIVRLWESTQPAPYASLPAPGGAAVLDVAVIDAKEIVVAFCSNCWFHIWDLYEECLLQTIKVNFPFLGVLGKKAEFGPYCIHPGPSPKLPSNTSSESLHQQLDEEQVIMPLECDEEYTRFNRSEVLIMTCSDYVFVLPLHDGTAASAARGPPPRAGTARRPSGWDLPEHVFNVQPISPRPPPSPTILPSPGSHSNSSTMKFAPATADDTLQDLDKLLENAGLQGILEKDFVMMQGLKHDLNKKLAVMKNNMKSMSSCVSMGGAYLALQCTAPTPVPPLDDMMDEYKRVVALFPELSQTGTPTVSNVSTPRKRNSSLLYVPSNCASYKRHNSSSSKE